MCYTVAIDRGSTGREGKFYLPVLNKEPLTSNAQIKNFLLYENPNLVRNSYPISTDCEHILLGLVTY